MAPPPHVRQIGVDDRSGEKLDAPLNPDSAWESGKNGSEDPTIVVGRFEDVGGVPQVWFVD